jgi:PadR family transcriptional regulator PadR
MNVENSKAQMKKGILELCILSIISRGEVYASNIIEELKASKMIVVEGTLYPLLTRLKNEGLLSYQWVESKSGPPRKYFQLTEDGKQFLDGLKETWTELVEAVSSVTQNQQNNTPSL